MSVKQDYSATDFERYYNGSMPPAEMHALEKAALDDPFLADALQGYAFTKSPTADVAAIKQRFQPSGKVRSIMQNRRVWLGIAALLILLVAFGWMTNFFTAKNGNNLADQVTPAAKQVTPADSITNKPESIAPVRQPANLSNESITKNETAKKYIKAKRSVEEKSNVVITHDNAPTPQTFSKPHIAAPMASATRKAPADSLVAGNIQGIVVDAQNAAVPNAVISDAQKKVLTTSDMAGNFEVPVADTNLTVTVNAVGYQSRQLMLMPTDSTAKIVLQPSNSSLNEVVVTAKSKVAGQSSRVRLEAVAPVSGWNRFHQYVDENLKTPETIDDNMEKSEVVLSFDVDNNGNAVNIAVEKSACTSCDSTAVQLIQQASRWRKTKVGKARAHVRF